MKWNLHTGDKKKKKKEEKEKAKEEKRKDTRTRKIHVSESSGKHGNLVIIGDVRIFVSVIHVDLPRRFIFSLFRARARENDWYSSASHRHQLRS